MRETSAIISSHSRKQQSRLMTQDGLCFTLMGKREWVMGVEIGRASKRLCFVSAHPPHLIFPPPPRRTGAGKVKLHSFSPPSPATTPTTPSSALLPFIYPTG